MTPAPPVAFGGAPPDLAPTVVTPARATDGEGPRNLAPVIAIIPKECYDNPAWKGLAYIARDTAVYVAMLVAIASTDRWYALIPMWWLSGFVVGGLFVLGHDAAHGALFASRRMNAIFGRLLMLPSMHVYESWVYGHNRLHHGHTVRQGADFVWHPITVDNYRKLSSFGRALVRIEWSWVGPGLYFARNIWLNMMRWKQPDSLAKKIRRDQMFVWAFMFAACVTFAAWGWSHYGTILGACWAVVKLFVIPSMCFMHAIGMAVYIHHIEPEIKWWPSGTWDKFKGQMEGTTIKNLPFPMDFFVHYIMVHVPHHVDMRIPFYNLPKAGAAIVAAFPDVVRVEKFSMREYIRTTQRCKLYDFQAREWLPYSSADAPDTQVAVKPAQSVAV